MISCTSPPEQKFPPAPVNTMARTASAARQLAEQVAQLRIGIESQRVLALGAIQGDDTHPPFLPPEEMLGLRSEATHVRTWS